MQGTSIPILLMRKLPLRKVKNLLTVNTPRKCQLTVPLTIVLPLSFLMKIFSFYVSSAVANIPTVRIYLNCFSRITLFQPANNILIPVESFPNVNHRKFKVI